MGLLSVLINPLILITSIILSLMIIYIFYTTYLPYFFPTLNEVEINKLIKNNNTYKQELLLIKGIIPLNHNTPINFSTIDQNSSNYIKFYESINQDGGNQYSYSFWFNKKKNNYTNTNEAIFSQGGNSPRILFGDTKELVIEFITTQYQGARSIKRKSISNKLFDITDHDNWYMITVILKDYRDYKRNNFESGVELSVYLNDSLLELERYEDETLKLEFSEFVILPVALQGNSGNEPGGIADIRYFNYALTHLDIIKLYKKNFNNEVFKTYLQNKKTNVKTQSIHKINIFNQMRLNS